MLPVNTLHSDSRTRKTKHTSITDVKSISVRRTATSVTLFIFPASPVLSKNYSGLFTDRAGRGIKRRWNRVQYHSEKTNTLLWQCLGVYEQPGRKSQQSKHVHRELKEEDLRPFSSGLCSTSIKEEGRKFLNEQLKTETLKVSPSFLKLPDSHRNGERVSSLSTAKPSTNDASVRPAVVLKR